jgi:hypothetical protein
LLWLVAVEECNPEGWRRLAWRVVLKPYLFVINRECAFLGAEGRASARRNFKTGENAVLGYLLWGLGRLCG